MRENLLKMSYDGRRNLGACKSNYIAIQSCLGYTGLVLQAEEQMLDWACLTALWGTLHTIYNGNSLGGSRRPRELLPWIPNTVDSLTLGSWADLHITRHPVRTRRLGLLANHRIQHFWRGDWLYSNLKWVTFCLAWQRLLSHVPVRFRQQVWLKRILNGRFCKLKMFDNHFWS